MNSSQPIQICYCGNRKVFPQILLSVMSVAMHTSAAVCVRVFTMELTEVDEAFVPITQEQRAVLEHVLRGKNAEEAILDLDMFLDGAVRAGLNEVTIVHGKGTGVLRKAVQAHLRKHPNIRTFRTGVYGEGEEGVTIAELK